MVNTTSCSHPLYISGIDNPFIAGAVLMDNLSISQIGHRLDSAMGMPGKTCYIIRPVGRSKMIQQQESIARDAIGKLEDEKRFRKPVVTKVEKFSNFYPAEEYHKDYFRNNPDSPYCMFVIAPKLEKFRKSHTPLLVGRGNP